MSDKIKDGGAAFPVPNDANVNGQPGMSLRDWFAGQALPIAAELCHKAFKAGQVNDYGFDSIAQGSYELADAMLAAREKKP